MVKKLLKSSKISWHSSFYATGFYLLLGLGCISATFLILQTTHLIQGIVATLFLIIFCLLLIYKFPQYWHLVAIFLGVIITLCFINQRTSELEIGEPILIYSDQVKVSDNFFYGEGKIGKNKLTEASISSIVQKLYDSRNYYIHGDEKSKYKNLVTDFNEMYDLRSLCQEVLRFYIFQELGLEYDEEY